MWSVLSPVVLGEGEIVDGVRVGCRDESHLTRGDRRVEGTSHRLSGNGWEVKIVTIGVKGFKSFQSREEKRGLRTKNSS